MKSLQKRCSSERSTRFRPATNLSSSKTVSSGRTASAPLTTETRGRSLQFPNCGEANGALPVRSMAWNIEGQAFPPDCSSTRT